VERETHAFDYFRIQNSWRSTQQEGWCRERKKTESAEIHASAPRAVEIDFSGVSTVSESRCKAGHPGRTWMQTMPVRISPDWLVVQGAPFAQSPQSFRRRQSQTATEPATAPAANHIDDTPVQHPLHDALTDAPPRD
jgi:hypothetical protein